MKTTLCPLKCDGSVDANGDDSLQICFPKSMKGFKRKVSQFLNRFRFFFSLSHMYFFLVPKGARSGFSEKSAGPPTVSLRGF